MATPRSKKRLTPRPVDSARSRSASARHRRHRGQVLQDWPGAGGGSRLPRPEPAEQPYRDQTQQSECHSSRSWHDHVCHRTQFTTMCDGFGRAPDVWMLSSAAAIRGVSNGSIRVTPARSIDLSLGICAAQMWCPRQDSNLRRTVGKELIHRPLGQPPATTVREASHHARPEA